MSTEFYPDYIPQSNPILQGGKLLLRDFDYIIHCGKVTVVLLDHTHRTFWIHSSPYPDRDRLASLKIGPHRKKDWRPFAHVSRNGIEVFKDLQGTRFDHFAGLLRDPARYQSIGYEYWLSAFCRVCGRELTRPDSIRRGIGPICGGWG